MSKIGKINISIPEKVKVALAGNILNIEGPLGKKTINIDLNMFNLDIKDGKEISIKPKKIDQETKRLWGMNRSLIKNAVIGSNSGYEKILELVGVGYRASLKGNQLNLQLGYSHDINFDIPEGIKITVEKQTNLKITGADKQQVGEVVSKLKTLRKIEPYKGKGIREKGQYIIKKEGKKK
tara:strand:- start:254 stop:793 length:540 start_codon:yes stop_codon:yes gene_type:complete